MPTQAQQSLANKKRIEFLNSRIGIPNLEDNSTEIASIKASLQQNANLGSAAFQNIGTDTGNIPQVPLPMSVMPNAKTILDQINTAAYQPAEYFATASQGSKADSAIQTQVQTDWNASTGLAKILNKPSLSTVATSGAYADLSGKPSIPASQINSDWNASSGITQISNKPSLATIATSGLYSDLTSKPTLGTASAQNISVFATALQGTKADSALQSEYDPVASAALSTHASLTTSAHGGIATSAQGAKADTALQSVAASSASVAGTMSASDYSKLLAIPAYAARSFTNNASHAIQTVAASANGFQLSSTRDALVNYSISISTSATIGGAATGYVVMEVCSTNSTVAANWQEIARSTNSQTITLAVTLQSVQIVGGAMTGMIPAGYYARLRSVNTTGTPVYSYVSGQEVLL